MNKWINEWMDEWINEWKMNKPNTLLINQLIKEQKNEGRNGKENFYLKDENESPQTTRIYLYLYLLKQHCCLVFYLE